MAAWLDLVHDSTGWALVDTGRMNQIMALEAVWADLDIYARVCSIYI